MKHRGRILIALILGLGLSGWGSLRAHAETPRAVSGEYVVKLKSGVVGQKAKLWSAVTNLVKSGQIQSVQFLKTSKSLMRLKLSGNEAQTFSTLLAGSEIESIEPNWIFEVFENERPSDPRYSELWGLENTGQISSKGLKGRKGVDVGVAPVWASGEEGSPNVIVAVIDSGVDRKHPDLQNAFYVNPGEIPDNGVDDDSNGYIDDVSGYDVLENTPVFTDSIGHGTHVAGTIAAARANGVGVAGVAPRVRILPIRATDRVATLASLIEALDYARTMKAQIINASWGGIVYSKLLEEAVERVSDAGILLVAAAGNSARDNDVTPMFPAGFPFPNIISVAAIDRQGVMPYFSNFGAGTVDIAAPGVGILSAGLVVPGQSSSEAYVERSGTSMAAPHVTGVAALLKSKWPEMKPADIREVLIQTAVKTRFLEGRVASGGYVSATAAFQGTSTPAPDRFGDVDFVPLPYELESPHPYPNATSPTEKRITEFRIQIPGVRALRVRFSMLDLEVTPMSVPLDWIRLSDVDGFAVQEITGHAFDVVSDYVDGDTLVIQLTSGPNGQHEGFIIDRVDVVY